MNKKSKEIVKKLCFTLVVVISIITIIGCPNTVSNKTDSGAEQNKPNPTTPPLPTDPVKEAIKEMEIIKGINDDVVTRLDGLGFGLEDGKFCLSSGKIGDLKGTSKSLFDANSNGVYFTAFYRKPDNIVRSYINTGSTIISAI